MNHLALLPNGFEPIKPMGFGSWRFWESGRSTLHPRLSYWSLESGSSLLSDTPRFLGGYNTLKLILMANYRSRPCGQYLGRLRCLG